MFASLSAQYLHTCSSILEEQVKCGNQAGAFDDTLADLLFKEEYRWSDFNVTIPALFCFTHGLELYIKAHLHAQNEDTEGHSLTELFDRLVSKTGSLKHFLRVPRKYVKNTHKIGLIDELLRRGLNRSYRELPKRTIKERPATEIDFLHEVLRYPSTRNGRRLLKDSVVGQGDMYFEDLNQLIADCKSMKDSLIKLKLRRFKC